MIGEPPLAFQHFSTINKSPGDFQNESLSSLAPLLFSWALLSGMASGGDGFQAGGMTLTDAVIHRLI